MATIYKDKMELIEAYKDVLAEIEKANPKKDGTKYDMGVCFDMLIDDYKAHKNGKAIEYKFNDSETFDWDKFGKELETL